jgi:hypothetical protein
MNDWMGLVPAIAPKHGIEPKLVVAIIMKESSGVTFRARFEPEWRYFVGVSIWAQKLVQSFATEKSQQQTSWGLMQVMGSVARERGFCDYLPRLIEPELGIEYGCKQLAYLKTRWSNLHDVISAYNQGSPLRDSKGDYKNKQYVLDVLENYGKAIV